MANDEIKVGMSYSNYYEQTNALHKKSNRVEGVYAGNNFYYNDDYLGTSCCGSKKSRARGNSIEPDFKYYVQNCETGLFYYGSSEDEKLKPFKRIYSDTQVAEDLDDDGVVDFDEIKPRDSQRNTLSFNMNTYNPISIFNQAK